MNITAIIMAAGSSKRLGSNKLFLTYKGQTLLQHTLQVVRQAGFWQTLVVLSPQNAALANLSKEVPFVINTEYAKGQSASVKLGVEHATGDAYVFFTADQPYLDVKSIWQITEKATEKTIVVPAIKGRQGSPVCFGRLFRQELLGLQGDEGGRPVKKNHPEACVLVEIENQKLFYDIDTPRDYENLLQNKD